MTIQTLMYLPDSHTVYNILCGCPFHIYMILEKFN